MKGANARGIETSFFGMHTSRAYDSVFVIEGDFPDPDHTVVEVRTEPSGTLTWGGEGYGRLLGQHGNGWIAAVKFTGSMHGAPRPFAVEYLYITVSSPGQDATSVLTENPVYIYTEP